MNTVILNNFVVGVYCDKDLLRMLKELSDYYSVNEKEFVIETCPECGRM